MYFFSSLAQNQLIRRLFIIAFTAITILGMAGSCNFPGLGSRNGRGSTTLGILKRDPGVKQEGFVRANAVRTITGEVDTQGLGNLSGIKMQRVDKDTMYLLTTQRGLFKTTNAGQVWQRLYIFPVSSNSSDEKQRQQEIATQIDKNNSFVPSDFAVDPKVNQIIYIAGKLNNIGKIYQSLDGGETFREIYSEIREKIGVLFVAVDPINNLKVYAILQEGALLQSLDGGTTWKKIRSFSDDPAQIGFVPQYGGLFYILFEKTGLAVSRDDGRTWNVQELTKAPSEIGENQPKDGLDINFKSKPDFGTYEKIIPVTTGLNSANSGNVSPWILIADRQIWYSQNAGKEFRKLVLPLQNEQYNILDVAPDPYSGLNKLWVSIDNRIFETNNRGQSWSVKDHIKLEGSIGNIGQIIVDSDNPQVVYLMLVSSRLTRGKGTFI